MKEETTLQNCMYVLEDNIEMGSGKEGGTTYITYMWCKIFSNGMFLWTQ